MTDQVNHFIHKPESGKNKCPVLSFLMLPISFTHVLPFHVCPFPVLGVSSPKSSETRWSGEALWENQAPCDSAIAEESRYSDTVKPFKLAALKVGDLACKMILAPSILAN